MMVRVSDVPSLDAFQLITNSFGANHCTSKAQLSHNFIATHATFRAAWLRSKPSQTTIGRQRWKQIACHSASKVKCSSKGKERGRESEREGGGRSVDATNGISRKQFAM